MSEQLPAIPEDAANPPARKPMLSRVELLAAGLALAGAGMATLAVLAARAETARGAAVASAPSATPLQPKPDAMLTRSGPGWTVNNARWVGNARKSIAFEAPSYNKISIWTRDVRPLLVVRCYRSAADVFVFTDSAAQIEPQTEDHTVRYAFDDEQEVRELWPDSAEHDALFAPDGWAFARRLMDARTMRFEFTPHNAAPATAHFQVSGLRDVLAPSAGECSWARN